VGIDEETGKLTLVIFDHLDWITDTNNHKFLLKEKLKDYGDYIESGQIYENKPEFRGKSIVISIVGKYPLSKDAQIFYDGISKIVREELSSEIKFKILEK